MPAIPAASWSTASTRPTRSSTPSAWASGSPRCIPTPRRFCASRRDPSTSGAGTSRARYPDGRGGYNAWRRACQEHHAGLIAEILARHGYAAAEIDHVAKLIKKQQLKSDPESQALENVVDVVFVEHYIDDFLAGHPDYDEEKLVDIIGKILRKMNAKGHAEVLALALRPGLRDLIGKAMARDAPAKPAETGKE